MKPLCLTRELPVIWKTFIIIITSYCMLGRERERVEMKVILKLCIQFSLYTQLKSCSVCVWLCHHIVVTPSLTASYHHDIVEEYMNVIKFQFYRILSVTVGTVLIIDSALSAQYIHYCCCANVITCISFLTHLLIFDGYEIVMSIDCVPTLQCLHSPFPPPPSLSLVCPGHVL